MMFLTDAPATLAELLDRAGRVPQHDLAEARQRVAEWDQANLTVGRSAV
ncbi:MAG: hypothetical protein U0990_09780 [Candidatus Nanopelagicales bacterium]|nr:hypothetical protein [Candidatus Nanopelagicales bacterium]